MRCHHMILHISYKDHVTNEEVSGKIQKASDHTKTFWLTFRSAIWSVCTCLPFIRSGQNHLARYIKWGRRRGRQKKRMRRQPLGMDRSGVRQIPEDGREEGNVRGNWLWSHPWCLNDTRGVGIGEGDYWNQATQSLPKLGEKLSSF